MEVILLEKIKKLGAVGETVTVKDGYGRNYLIPKQKALRATLANKEIFEKRRAEIEKANAEKLASAQAIAKKIDGMSVNLVKQAAEDGKLYGSVTATDIAAVLSKKSGENIAPECVELTEKYKTTGVYVVEVSLHPDVAVNINVSIATSEESASKALKEKQAEGSSETKGEEAAEK